MTDFAATLDPKAAETVNSSVDNHAWLDNFIILLNQKNVKVGEHEVVIHDCNVIQYFGSTMSKGKKI